MEMHRDPASNDQPPARGHQAVRTLLRAVHVVRSELGEHVHDVLEERDERHGATTCASRLAEPKYALDLCLSWL
jgi:hypothetical protein